MHLNPRVNKRTFAPFELVHSDVWDPYLVLSPTRFKYFVIFVDDFSRVTWLYLMKSRSEFFFLILVLFVLKFKHNFMSLCKHSEVIMPRNIFRNLFNPLCYNMGFSIKPRVLIHPFKMG